MKILKLEILKDNQIFEYSFDSNNLIYSENNSSGKTTLIRFILHALCYSIPATEGIVDFTRYETLLYIESKNVKYKVHRKKEIVTVITDKLKVEYILPIQEDEVHSYIFGIENISVLNNLLATYYIDQEKGWTLLNRGKIIGNNRFSIEEFIAGLSDRDIDNLLLEKNNISAELKKYKQLENIVKINEEFEDISDTEVIKHTNMDELLFEQKKLNIEITKHNKKIKNYMDILQKNKNYVELIFDMNLTIKYKQEEFILKKENLLDYSENEDLIKIQLNKSKICKSKAEKRLKIVSDEINSRNKLFDLNDMLDDMVKHLNVSNINVDNLDKIIQQLQNQRTKINKQIKEKLSFNNEILYTFYSNVCKYANELGISKFVGNDSKYILTNKLKGFSGRILTQMCFVFKLSYILAIKEKYGLDLPIIIDSPRTNEMSKKSTDDMITILKRDFSDHQTIIASIYKETVLNNNIILLSNGIFSDNYRIK